ncbi:unnamed protein product [Arabis nemorensis]|uniref:Uncharacterized protein n=1 Tax=Arabis nemorensis TaxID=586526 RepID=A0A565BND7_9BRAS|nr:unnamed protein product [Arabis nemorensis]
MIGVLVRGFECQSLVKVRHLQCFLEFCQSKVQGPLMYNVSNKANRKIISGFQSKDHLWRYKFFFVSISNASVGEEYIKRVRSEWGILGSRFVAYSAIFADLLYGHWANFRFTNCSPRRIWLHDQPFVRLEPRRRELPAATVSKSPTKPTSDASDKLVLATDRPTKSALVLHEDEQQDEPKRRLSKADKGKGLAAEASSKKPHRALPTLNVGEPILRTLVLCSTSVTKELYHDSYALTSLLSKMTYLCESFPIPDTLLRSGLYNEMSSRCAKFIAHLTRMTLAYDSDFRSACAKANVDLEQAAQKIKALEADVELHKNNYELAGNRIHELESGRAKTEAQIATMISQLDAQQRHIEQAISEAKEEFMTSF